MKKMLFVTLISITLFMQSTGQAPDNKGQFTVFLSSNYHPVLDDVLQVTRGMYHMEDQHFYKLRNGQTFWVYSPSEFVKIMTAILTKVKKSPVTNIADELYTCKIVPYNDNISTRTTNYAVTKDGKTYIFNKNYKGGDSVYVLVYMGYPVLKIYKACFNPLDPEIDTVPIVVVPKTEIPVEKKIEEKKVEEKAIRPEFPDVVDSKPIEKHDTVVILKTVTVVNDNYRRNSNNYNNGWTTPVGYYYNPAPSLFGFLRININGGGGNNGGNNNGGYVNPRGSGTNGRSENNYVNPRGSGTGSRRH